VQKENNKICKTVSTIWYCIQFAWESSNGYTIGGIALSLISIVIPFCSLYLSKVLLDSFTNINQTEAMKVVGILLLTYVLSITNITVTKTFRYMQTVHNDLMENRIQTEFMEKSMALDLEFFDNPVYVDAMQAARMDASAIPNIMWNVMSAFNGMLSLFSAFVFLSKENWLLALIVVVSGIPYSYFNQKHANDIYKWRMCHVGEERQLGHIQMIAGSRTFACDVRVFGIEEYLLDRYKKIYDVLIYGRKHMRKKQLIAGIVSGIMPEICALIIMIYITQGIFSGRNTLGDYTLFTGLLSTLIASLSAVTMGIAHIYEDKLKVDTVKRFKGQENHVLDEGKLHLDNISEIEFRNVSFHYPDTEYEVLKDISFCVHKGEKVCLVGANGAGKSTIIKLVLRFYDVTQGQVLINGIDIREYTLASVRNGFSTLFQQYDKMAFSLRENIMLSDIKKEKCSDQDVIEALKQAGAIRILEKVNYNLDAPLSRLFDSHGLELSGGEMQKVGLARAIYRLRTAIIFDEPSAALDPVSETKLFEYLQEYLKGKTTIFTTHRMNTVHLADKIIVVKGGYVCENGTHEELLKLNGIYAELFKVQAEKFKVA